MANNGFYLLVGSNQHKTKGSGSVVGFFKEVKSSEKKVLHKLKKEWKSWFDSSEDRDQFVKQAEQDGLVKALQSNTDIYGYCEWVEEIS